jgi:hypothetical protein
MKSFDAAAFDAAFAGRRLFMLGDSLMRLHFYSMACLLRSRVVSGSASEWSQSSIKWKGNYTVQWGDRTINVSVDLSSILQPCSPAITGPRFLTLCKLRLSVLSISGMGCSVLPGCTSEVCSTCRFLPAPAYPVYSCSDVFPAAGVEAVCGRLHAQVWGTGAPARHRGVQPNAF